MVNLNKVSDLDRAVEEVAVEFKKGEEKVHVLGDIISIYLNNPLKNRELDYEELREDIKFDLKSSLEHDGHL